MKNLENSKSRQKPGLVSRNRLSCLWLPVGWDSGGRRRSQEGGKTVCTEWLFLSWSYGPDGCQSLLACPRGHSSAPFHAATQVRTCPLTCPSGAGMKKMKCWRQVRANQDEASEETRPDMQGFEWESRLHQRAKGIHQ